MATRTERRIASNHTLSLGLGLGDLNPSTPPPPPISLPPVTLLLLHQSASCLSVHSGIEAYSMDRSKIRAKRGRMHNEQMGVSRAVSVLA